MALVLFLLLGLFGCHRSPEGDACVIVVVRGDEMIAWDPASDDEAVIENAADLMEFGESHR